MLLWQVLLEMGNILFGVVIDIFGIVLKEFEEQLDTSSMKLQEIILVEELCNAVWNNVCDTWLQKYTFKHIQSH